MISGDGRRASLVVFNCDNQKTRPQKIHHMDQTAKPQIRTRRQHNDVPSKRSALLWRAGGGTCAGCFAVGADVASKRLSSSFRLLRAPRNCVIFCLCIILIGELETAADDNELLVRTSAVLKSQGQIKLAPWETRPPLGAHKPALCPGHTMMKNYTPVTRILSRRSIVSETITAVCGSVTFI